MENLCKECGQAQRPEERDELDEIIEKHTYVEPKNGNKYIWEGKLTLEKFKEDLRAWKERELS